MAYHKIRGFTLIEILAAIAILGILAAILIPAVRGIMQSARHSEQASNMRQAGIASLAFASDNNGRLPYLWTFDVEGPYPANRSWHYFIAPYLEVGDLEWWQQQYWGPNMEGVPIWVGPFYDFACWSFAMNETWIRQFSNINFAAHSIVGGAPMNQIENPERTFLFVEVEASTEQGGSPWVGGVTSASAVWQPKRHRGRSAYVMVDASVQFIDAEYIKDPRTFDYWGGGMR